MPKIEEKPLVAETFQHTLNLIKDNLRTLAKEDCKLEDKQKIICEFYKSGNLNQCMTCLQEDEDIGVCVDEYRKFMRTNPSMHYSEKTIRKKVRDRVRLNTLDFIGLNCNICYIKENCPLFQDGSMCAINWKEEGKKTPAEVLDFMVDVQMERVERSRLFEQVDGGMPDENLSKELEKLRLMNEQRMELMKDKFSLKIEASSSTGGLSAGGGILSKIFGYGNQKQLEETPEIIEIPHEEVKEKKIIKKKG